MKRTPEKGEGEIKNNPNAEAAWGDGAVQESRGWGREGDSLRKGREGLPPAKLGKNNQIQWSIINKIPFA